MPDAELYGKKEREKSKLEKKREKEVMTSIIFFSTSFILLEFPDFALPVKQVSRHLMKVIPLLGVLPVSSLPPSEFVRGNGLQLTQPKFP